VADWRAFRGWDDDELDRQLAALADVARSFPDAIADDLVAHGYEPHRSEAVVGWEAPGPPLADGAFARVRQGVTDYLFSDPRIVTAHFAADEPLRGRRMLLELRVLGLRFLTGTVVSEVFERDEPDRTLFGFRYDTLEGHVESGSEWFILTKHHETGAIVFRIDAAWRAGDFPNWWSRLGFALLARRYQENWHRLAYLRLRRIAGSPRRALAPLPRRGRLIHAGPRHPEDVAEWRFPEVSRGAPLVHPAWRRRAVGIALAAGAGGAALTLWAWWRGRR
jgi:uncharacterized protein (UPF0548 family)